MTKLSTTLMADANKQAEDSHKSNIKSGLIKCDERITDAEATLAKAKTNKQAILNLVDEGKLEEAAYKSHDIRNDRFA